MTRYAAATDVSVERTQAEISRLLKANGAVRWLVGEETGRAIISFETTDRRIRIDLPLPTIDEFGYTPERGLRRTPQAQHTAYDQALRQRWRALLLVLKSKFEAIASGIETLDQAFLPHLVMPGGQTLGQHLLPRLDDAYRTGHLSPLLPAPPP